LTKAGSLRALALTINVLGTLVVLIGTFGSAYAQWVGGNGSRALGVLLIGVGTLIVAAGASLTRYGHHMLYGPMVLGLLVIFAGYRRATAPGSREGPIRGVHQPAPRISPVSGEIRTHPT
jgi:uncharacterized membrane protein YfcA